MSGIHLMPKPYAFIQARLGSTRFPEKILESIILPTYTSGITAETSTLLDHIFSRLSKVLPPNQIVFLIPKNDRKLHDFLDSRKYQVFGGSEIDVHSRYVEASDKFEAEHIIRLTGDNPLIDITSVELLIEAMIYHTGKDFCLSMTGLPLGMGVECFSRSALKKSPKNGWAPHHREHVSLHIKEDLDNFIVRRFDPPHLDSEFIKSAGNIRMTIDEQKDLDLVQKVASHCGVVSPFFGAEEVFQLYQSQPELFTHNQDVQQVRFDLPKNNKPKKFISIAYGAPAHFGSGHFERTKSLSLFLQSHGYAVSMSPEENLDSILQIWDQRDLLPGHPQTLCLDNKNPLLGQMGFENIDLLPHPSHKLKLSETHFYTSPLVEEFKSKEKAKSKSKVINERSFTLYLGNLGRLVLVPFLDGFFRKAGEWGFEDIELITNLDSKEFSEKDLGQLTIPNLVKPAIHRRLFRTEFLNLLSGSSAFASYFGIGLLEAMYLEKKVAVFGISLVHEELGEYSKELFKIPYWGRLTDNLANIEQPEKTNRILKRESENTILDWIKRNWKEN